MTLTPEGWRAAKAVVADALETPAADRPRLVAERCGADDALRAEVESLLAAAAGARDSLAVPGTLRAAALAADGEETARVAGALGDRYAVQRELGRGGMATVYLARDLRHGRGVAVKVLHPELAAVLGPERFLKEIELTARLQHPHVLPLFDSGAAGGLLYYVMPFVEGGTLRARLARERQLPVADAVRVATEVAGALDYAHRHGVVHRDVKPENVLLGDGGQALVADFGIALAISNAGGRRVTQTGLSVGTPQYMSPEQATGDRVVDCRADVYSLGAVLYEMLAGEPPHAGATAQAIIARLMTEEPRPLTVVRRAVPPHIDAAVRTALEKLPADRFPTAGAFAAALADPATAVAAPPTRAARRPLVPALLGAAALAAAAGGGWALGRAPADAGGEREPVRFTIEPDSGVVRIGAAAISPDARTVVYIAESADGVRLHARRLDAIGGHAIAGTENAEAPFFSPDGAWVGFYSDGALRKVRLDGGAPALVTPVPLPARFWSATWGSDDTISYALRDGPLYRVPAAGGAASPVAVADSSLRLFHPEALPGGRALLVTVNGARVGVLELASGRVRPLVRGGHPRYAAGHLVYATAGGALYRAPFDVARLEPTGPAEQLPDAWAPAPRRGAPLAVSATGAFVYHAGAQPTGYTAITLRLVDAAGRDLRVLPARRPWAPRFSPDGRRLAYSAYAPGHDSSDVWVADLETGATQRLTADAQGNNDPVWSRDGRSIAFSREVPGGKDVYVQSLEGGPPRPVVRRPDTQFPADWAPGGSALLFDEALPNGGFDIWVQPADGAPARPYLATPAHEIGARVSPDGRWVAYQSDETGRDEVYVQSYPAPGRRTPVSVAGGAYPVWRRDGRVLYYWRGDELIAARLDAAVAGGPLVVRGRTPLFRAPYLENILANYDVSPDGQQLAIVTGGARSSRLVVALDALGAVRPPRAR